MALPLHLAWGTDSVQIDFKRTIVRPASGLAYPGAVVPILVTRLPGVARTRFLNGRGSEIDLLAWGRGCGTRRSRPSAWAVDNN